ncbi:unnamed protein product [Clavelina lepadiformis]|uniref:Succinate dehydrogenase assembly factor 2, mitochondrial n=1 Tax=Clavelina lepadiformis TaxID=159417 RepID=A0ABP0F1X0_CLALP
MSNFRFCAALLRITFANTKQQKHYFQNYKFFYSVKCCRFGTSSGEYVISTPESLVQKRARLLWQSRKRGIAENCLIFSTFSAKHLNNFDEEQLESYDKLLNQPSNEWDIYYWMVGTKPVPETYDDDLMRMLQEHCRNERKEERFEQPPLNYEPVTK